MKFSYSLLFSTCAVLAQTSSELVNTDLQLVQQAMEALQNSTSFQNFQEDRANGQELLKADLEAIKDDPAVKAYWDAQKALFQVAKDNNVTSTNVQGLREGSLNTTGNTDFDAKFADLKLQREQLLQNNTAFAKFEADKENIQASTQEQIQIQSQDPLVKALRDAQQKLREDAKAENITLPGPGQPMNFASSSNTTSTDSLLSNSTSSTDIETASATTTTTAANFLADVTSSSVVITSTKTSALGLLATKSSSASSSATTTMSVAALAGDSTSTSSSTETATVDPAALVDPLATLTISETEQTDAVDPSSFAIDSSNILSSASNSALSMMVLGAVFLTL